MRYSLRKPRIYPHLFFKNLFRSRIFSARISVTRRERFYPKIDSNQNISHCNRFDSMKIVHMLSSPLQVLYGWEGGTRLAMMVVNPANRTQLMVKWTECIYPEDLIEDEIEEYIIEHHVPPSYNIPVDDRKGIWVIVDNDEEDIEHSSNTVYPPKWKGNPPAKRWISLFSKWEIICNFKNCNYIFITGIL